MSLEFALLISVIFQFVTAVLAMTLIKRTRTNVAWWLISGGFFLMAIRRLIELLQEYGVENILVNSFFSSWLEVLISVLMLLSLSFIRRIFNIQKRLDNIKKENQARIFSAIINTEEDQKNKFSKELHDGLGPLLATVKMSISSLVSNTESEKNLKILLNTENLIDESIRTVKEISNNLSPHILSNFGLNKAVKSFINKLDENNNQTIHFNSNISEKRYEQTIEFVVYRVICELIINSLKHACANNIFIDIFEESKYLKIKYSDDGIGFNYQENDENFKGAGLLNIKSRINSVNGKSYFFSKKDEGFASEFSIKF